MGYLIEKIKKLITKLRYKIKKFKYGKTMENMRLIIERRRKAMKKIMFKIKLYIKEKKKVYKDSKIEKTRQTIIERLKKYKDFKELSIMIIKISEEIKKFIKNYKYVILIIIIAYNTVDIVRDILYHIFGIIIANMDIKEYIKIVIVAYKENIERNGLYEILGQLIYNITIIVVIWYMELKIKKIQNEEIKKNKWIKRLFNLITIIKITSSLFIMVVLIVYWLS